MILKCIFTLTFVFRVPFGNFEMVEERNEFLSCSLQALFNICQTFKFLLKVSNIFAEVKLFEIYFAFFGSDDGGMQPFGYDYRLLKIYYTCSTNS